jgi:hypothetical protein
MRTATCGRIAKMGLRTAALVVSVVAWFAGPMSAAAEEPAAPRPTLRLRADPGKPVHFVHRYRSEVRSYSEEMEKQLRKAGMSVTNTRVDVDTEFSLEIRENLPEGGARGTLRFGRCRLVEDGSVRKSSTSTSDGPVPANVLDWLSWWKHLGWGSSEFSIEFAADGRVAKIGGQQEAEAAREKQLVIPKDQRFLLTAAFRGPTIGQLVSHSLAVTPYPARPLAKGMGWRCEDALPWVLTGSELMLVQDVEAVRIDVAEVEIRGKGTARAEPSEAAKAAKLPSLLKESVRNSKVGSVVVISLADGLPRSAKTEVSFELASESALMTNRRTVTTTVERVNAWPSPR